MDGQITLVGHFLAGLYQLGPALLFISKWLKTVLNHITAAGQVERYGKGVTVSACTLYILHIPKYFLCHCQQLRVRKVSTGLAECEKL